MGLFDTRYSLRASLSGTKDVKHDTVPFLKRWSIMTNTVDWVVATPNLGVEFDLAGNEKDPFLYTYERQI